MAYVGHFGPRFNPVSVHLAKQSRVCSVLCDFGAWCLCCVGPSVVDIGQGGLCWAIVFAVGHFGPMLEPSWAAVGGNCVISILDVEEVARAIGFECFSGQPEIKLNMEISISIYSL